MDDSHALNAKQEGTSKGSRKKIKKDSKRKREVENGNACLLLKGELKAANKTKKKKVSNRTQNLNQAQKTLTQLT